MRLDILIQFIVPLTFLAIWALTTLLNRDAKPLPPRPGRTQPPRPGFPPARGADPRPLPGEFQPSRAPEPTSNRNAFGEPLPGSGRAGSPPPLSTGDAIVYLETDTRTVGASRPTGSRSAGPSGNAASNRAQARGAGRRPARPRTADPGIGTPARNDGAPRRALSDQMQESMALRKAKPLEIAPLGAPMKRLSRPLSHASVSMAAQDGAQVPIAGPTAVDLRRLLATPERLRESLVLTEILRPPLALRGRR